MRNLQFQKAKLKRIIGTQGEDVTFLRDTLNEFNEPNGESLEVAKLRGIWHESNEYITLSKQDSSVVRSKSNPRILALFEEAQGIK